MSIPFRLNLEQQKKRAKELLKAVKAEQAEAITRVNQAHPKFVHNEATLEDTPIQLADTQLVIARELGCKTWLQLKSHIQLMDSLRDQLEQGHMSDDEPNSCLHIRCGSDIQQALPEAGFHGDFLEFSDPLCGGPVSYEYDIESRAVYLYQCFGETIGRSEADFVGDVRGAYERLLESAQRYEHVVLWFEHDTYDQMILIFILSVFQRFGRPKRCWLVTTNAFPGSARFQGLGQLPPEGLRLLWQSKQAITDQQYEEADRHWAAFTDSDPAVFHRHVASMKSSALPYFQHAAERQVLEMPIEPNDLPLTQQLTLDLLAEGSITAGKLFGRLMREKEPLPFLGDLMFWVILKEMANKQRIVFENETEHWPETIVSLA